MNMTIHTLRIVLRRQRPRWATESSSSSSSCWDTTAASSFHTTTTSCRLLRRDTRLHSVRRSVSSSQGGGRNSNQQRRNSNNNNPFRNTYGTPFSVAPEQAIAQFRQWATQQQGLPQWLVVRSNIAISAAYVPVWTFDLSLRYRQQPRGTVVTPSFFQPVYSGGTTAGQRRQRQQNHTLHIPGLSAYAGYTYRRSLVDAVHSTTVLAAASSSLQPFGAHLLHDLHFSSSSSSSSTTIPVFLDPWNAPQGRALEVVREALLALADGATDADAATATTTLATQVTQTRRVYLPTYIVQYSILGMEYQAFLSGCDPNTPVSGISHTLWDTSSSSSSDTSSSGSSRIHPQTVMAAWNQAVDTVGGRNVASLLALTLQWTASLLVRIATRIPWIAAVGGAYVGFRKLIRPWMDHRTASAAWERQREREARRSSSAADHWEDFVDTDGRAERYFHANRERIVRHLTGQGDDDTAEQQRNSSTYTAWEQWARQQWEQSQHQQQQQSQQRSYQQKRQQTRSRQSSSSRSGAKARKEYQWDFNLNDPYSVLGIQRGATATQVSSAFRQQMLRHHPDTKANASQAEQDQAIERSKLITNAYQTIKAEMKR